MKQLLREPLLHFFVLGALLFGLYAWLNPGADSGPTEIVVSRGQVQNLSAQFARVWQRAPTDRELKGLIDNWVREEIFYREGVAMGLDRDDPVVRRRVQQKVEFILDSAEPAAPTEPELQRWLDEHPESFRRDAVYELRQVYFDPDRRGEHLQRDLAEARRRLAAGMDVAGDSTLLPVSFHASSADVARTFGPRFESALRDLRTGSWQGPIESAFGLHLVELSMHVPARLPPLAEVRDAVERDLVRARAQTSATESYDRLRANYSVRIEGEVSLPSPPAG